MNDILSIENHAYDVDVITSFMPAIEHLEIYYLKIESLQRLKCNKQMLCNG